MSDIKISPVEKLGYDFIKSSYLPKGKDEYYLRLQQNGSNILFRKLNAAEIRKLEKNQNTSDDWSRVEVADPFDCALVKNCNFYGWVRIGKLEPYCLEYHDIRLPVGLYNSTIISCDLGNNIVVNHVNYMSHYIAGDEVILVNINELATTDHSKFGNGILKKGEKENIRIQLEVCNENGGRSIMPFNGMLPGDAYLWSRYRQDDLLMEKFRAFTEKRFDNRRGYYGQIGDHTVIKDCRIIKDTWIGADAYIKGTNKLKNLTINSGAEGKTQIGEGCELVNGIIGFGCRIFYGVKAVRFILASHSQLKYGARLINSYLGNNSTISCCEVLNSLIFPAHEQHHNNSFLCAALLMGQSNMAAGATIGSNHNSRGADGELIASRGFWPGLCVSLKHNSRFATFTIIAKGDYPSELNIPLPFSLVSNDVTHDRLQVMPCYWFMYNMYALARNESKYTARDNRLEKVQRLEYDFLAPDSVNEIFEALQILERSAGRAYAFKNRKKIKETDALKYGKWLLEKNNPVIDDLEIIASDFENSGRNTVLLKVRQAYKIYRELIVYYGVNQLLHYAWRNEISSWDMLYESLPMRSRRGSWINVGGQLMPQPTVQSLIRKIRSGDISSWDQVHAYYNLNNELYEVQKFQHAFASLLEITQTAAMNFDKKLLKKLTGEALNTREWLVKGIYDSRAKDHHNPFRKMVYETNKEMDKVLGKLSDNEFIKSQIDEMRAYRKKVASFLKQMKV